MNLYYVNMFLFYSILGNLFERIFMSLKHVDYVSGFMGSIFTPIYAIAAIIILFIHNKIKTKNTFIKIVEEFLIYGVVLSIIEFLGGYLIEEIFNKIYWNYTPFKYNLGKYISLESALLWALLSIILIYIIQPIFKKIEKHIPKIVTIIFSIFFIINIIYIFIVK